MSGACVVTTLGEDGAAGLGLCIFALLALLSYAVGRKLYRLGRWKRRGPTEEKDDG